MNYQIYRLRVLWIEDVIESDLNKTIKIAIEQ